MGKRFGFAHLPRPQTAGWPQGGKGAGTQGTGRERWHQGGRSAPLSAASNHSCRQKASRRRRQPPAPRTESQQSPRSPLRHRKLADTCCRQNKRQGLCAL